MVYSDPGSNGCLYKTVARLHFVHKKGIAVDRIQFDSKLYEKIVQTSKSFYEKYIVKALLKK